MDEEGRSKEEDELLRSIIKLSGDLNWDEIAVELQSKKFLKSAKQCRERWVSVLLGTKSWD
jgi:hypothetical protein